MNESMVDGLRHLSAQFSMSRDEWRKHYRGGDMLLDGLVAHGFTNHKGGRYAVNDAGRRALDALEPVEADD